MWIPQRAVNNHPRPFGEQLSEATTEARTGALTPHLLQPPLREQRMAKQTDRARTDASHRRTSTTRERGTAPRTIRLERKGDTSRKTTGPRTPQMKEVRGGGIAFAWIGRGVGGWQSQPGLRAFNGLLPPHRHWPVLYWTVPYATSPLRFALSLPLARSSSRAEERESEEKIHATRDQRIEYNPDPRRGDQTNNQPSPTRFGCEGGQLPCNFLGELAKAREIPRFAVPAHQTAVLPLFIPAARARSDPAATGRLVRSTHVTQPHLALPCRV